MSVSTPAVQPTRDDRHREAAPPLPYARHWIDEDDIQAVIEVLRSDRLTQGPRVGEFERAVAAYCGARHAVAVANGTAALHLAALAANVGPHDVGVTTPLTFLASANCILYCGGQVDFVDVNADTLCLDVELLETYCRTNPPPKAVVAVDYAGVPADLPALWELAGRYGFTLIEDASHALGSSYALDDRSYRCGGCAHAHLATLSFHPVKAITTAEGGMVLTNDGTTAARLRRLAGHGIERDPGRMERCDGPWYYEMQELGFNYRISDLQCALGLRQLAKLDGWIARRAQIVRCYNEAFADVAQTPPWPANTKPAYHIYVLRLTSPWRRARAPFVDRLRQRNILCQVHYIPVHTQPFYRAKGFRPGTCPHAEDTYERCISLPLYPRMTDADVDRVITAVRSILSIPP